MNNCTPLSNDESTEDIFESLEETVESIIKEIEAMLAEEYAEE